MSQILGKETLYRGKSNIAASKCRIFPKPCDDYILG